MNKVLKFRGYTAEKRRGWLEEMWIMCAALTYSSISKREKLISNMS